MTALRSLALPASTARSSLFERLPAVYRDPDRFQPLQEIDDTLAGAADWVSPASMITVGSEGDRIHRLQVALARSRHDPGPPDGDFGPRTEDAVRAFQRQRGLEVDGLVGPQTMTELTAPLLRRFLDGLETVLDPVVSTLDNLGAYATVGTAPESFLRWMSWIVGAEHPEEWDEPQLRAVVATSLDLHRSLGTVRGIAALAALHAGVATHQVQVADGGETSWDLDPDADLETTADRTVRVSLPAAAGEAGSAVVERTRQALEAALPVGFVLDLSVRGSADASDQGGPA